MYLLIYPRLLIHWTRKYTGMHAIYDIRPKHMLNLDLTKSRLRTTYFWVVKSFWKFTQRMTLSLTSSVPRWNCQKDLPIVKDVLTQQDSAIFQFKMRFEWISVSNMMTSSNGNIFRVTGHLCGKFTGPRWISHTKASDAELWCYLWFTPE